MVERSAAKPTAGSSRHENRHSRTGRLATRRESITLRRPPSEERLRIDEAQRVSERVRQIERALAPRARRNLPHRMTAVANVRGESTQLLRAGEHLFEVIHREVDMVPVGTRIARVAVA